MSTVGLIVLILIGLLLLLALGGAIANTSRRRARAHHFERSLDEVNRRLADAHAEDKGWERSSLESKARQIFEAEQPGVAIVAMTLVQVIDRPGTDEDKAVFRFETAAGRRHLTLGRSAGEWLSEGIGPGGA